MPDSLELEVVVMTNQVQSFFFIGDAFLSLQVRNDLPSCWSKSPQVASRRHRSEQTPPGESLPLCNNPEIHLLLVTKQFLFSYLIWGFTSLMISWLFLLIKSLTVSAKAGNSPSKRFSSLTLAPRMSKSMLVLRMLNFLLPPDSNGMIEAEPIPVTPSSVA